MSGFTYFRVPRKWEVAQWLNNDYESEDEDEDEDEDENENENKDTHENCQCNFLNVQVNKQ